MGSLTGSPNGSLVFQAKTTEPLVELGELSAAIEQTVDAGPGGMGFRVNVQLYSVTGATPR